MATVLDKTKLVSWILGSKFKVSGKNLPKQPNVVTILVTRCPTNTGYWAKEIKYCPKETNITLNELILLSRNINIALKMILC